MKSRNQFGQLNSQIFAFKTNEMNRNMLNSNGVCKKIECNKPSEARERERN